MYPNVQVHQTTTPICYGTGLLLFYFYLAITRYDSTYTIDKLINFELHY